MISPKGRSCSNSAARPTRSEVPSPLGPRCQLGQQARLPDPRLANQLHDARLTGGEAVERPVEIGELARSSDQ